MSSNVPLSLNLLGDDTDVIGYRKRFAVLTGSVTSAILLGRVLYWAKLKSFKPFYKFRQPCKHDLYKAGDSWIEDLEFTAAEFDNALKVIGTKIRKGISRKEVEAMAFPERGLAEDDASYFQRYREALRYVVVYWTDNAHVTWYQVNGDLLDKFINSIYLENSSGLKHLRRSVFADILEKRKVDSDQDPDQTPDQTQKEVVARDFFFHPIFLEATNDPTPRTLPPLRLVTPTPPLPIPAPLDLPFILVEQQRAELVALYQELFPTQLTPGVAANINDALDEFGLEIVRDSLREAKESKPKGFVHWKYIDPIMKRRKQQAAAGPEKPFESPYWAAFKARWKELTKTDLPDPTTPYLIKRFREATEALKHIEAEEVDIRALVDAKINEERYDYRFDYAATDIVPFVTKRKAAKPPAKLVPLFASQQVADDSADTPEAKAAALAAARQQLSGVLR